MYDNRKWRDHESYMWRMVSKAPPLFSLVLKQLWLAVWQMFATLNHMQLILVNIILSVVVYTSHFLIESKGVFILKQIMRGYEIYIRLINIIKNVQDRPLPCYSMLSLWHTCISMMSEWKYSVSIFLITQSFLVLSSDRGDKRMKFQTLPQLLTHSTYVIWFCLI